MNAREILERHVRLFNEGVRNGDFGPMIAQFSMDAEMRFEGIPVGPFKGKEEIRSSYGRQPPDDEIRVLGFKDGLGEDNAACDYAWSGAPGVKAGELELETSGGLIKKMTVKYLR